MSQQHDFKRSKFSAEYRGFRALRATLLVALFAAVLPAPTFAAKAKHKNTHTATVKPGVQVIDGDTAFLAARDAFRANEAVRLAKNIELLRGHALQPWADYWQLNLRLDDDATAAEADINAFLARHSGSYIADKLRGDWLRSLGKRGDWVTFARELPALVQVDDEVRCYAAQQLADASAVRRLFLDGKDLPAACETLARGLIESGGLTVEDVWQRIRHQLEAKRLGGARQSAAWLPSGEGWAESSRHLDSIALTPARALERLPHGFSHSRSGREMALFAVQRLARNDALEAARHMEQIEARLRPEERAYGWSQIATWGAMFHRPEAPAWFARAQGTPLSDEALAWQVRAALRAEDWPAVQRAIAALPASLAALPDWIYWRARALKAQGKNEDAQNLFIQIAGAPHFYSNLADEELGRSIMPPPLAGTPSADETTAAAANPALLRALALIRLDMRVEGVREWVYGLRGMDDRQLLAAAHFARRQEIWDRAINTADRTKSQHDYSLRYIAPFSDQVRPKAQQLALDDGWVYGLMRQESRFVLNANSSAGARGLMQIMPATAKWVAKKINLAGFTPDRIAEMDTNVTLGTHYMRMVLDSLDNHPVLASAAYNAGPGRAKRWRAERPLEGAIYAETIPFTETRDYVKKVMSNAVYYSALFEQRPQSLKARLGIIGPRAPVEAATDALP